MKRMLLLLFAGFFTVCSAGDAQPKSFRVASWNIGHFAIGKASASQLTPDEARKMAPEYIALLKSVNADLLGVAEYSENYSADGSLKALTTIFPDYPLFKIGPANDYQWNAQFMKRGKFLKSRVIDYEKRRQKTYFLCTELELDGRKVVWAATHLDWHAEPEPYRTGQILQLIRELENYPYVIITGDFNTKSGNEFKVFEEHGFMVGGKILDNIIVKGFRIRNFKYKYVPTLSDHGIAYADLEFLP